MELKLNIYKADSDEIEKVYTSQDFDLRTGTCEDLIRALDIDSMLKNIDNPGELGKMVLHAVVMNYDKFRPYIFRAFNGLTEEEFARTKFKEVGTLIIRIAVYTVNQLFSIMGTAPKGKNPKKA